MKKKYDPYLPSPWSWSSRLPFSMRAGSDLECEGQLKAVKGELGQLIQLLLWQPEPKEVTIDSTRT